MSKTSVKTPSISFPKIPPYVFAAFGVFGFTAAFVGLKESKAPTAAKAPEEQVQQQYVASEEELAALKAKEDSAQLKSLLTRRIKQHGDAYNENKSLQKSDKAEFELASWRFFKETEHNNLNAKYPAYVVSNTLAAWQKADRHYKSLEGLTGKGRELLLEKEPFYPPSSDPFTPFADQFPEASKATTLSK